MVTKLRTKMRREKQKNALKVLNKSKPLRALEKRLLVTRCLTMPLS